jgi:hypothetical protein
MRRLEVARAAADSLSSRLRAIVGLGLAALSSASVAAAIAAYAAVCFVFLTVFSAGHWTTGVVVSAVARAREGGHYYEGAGSLLGPSWPYFPLSVLLTHAFAALGVPLLSACPLLGGASAFLLPLAAAALSRQLGAHWVPSLAFSFGLHAVFMPRFHIFELVAGGFFPDACAVLFAILACVALGSLERAGRPSKLGLALFGACLVAAGLAKQAGVAGVAGSFVYLALLSQATRAMRRDLLLVVIAAGAAVLVVLLALPSCWEVTIATMARHPKDWSRLKVVVDGLVNQHLPAALVYVVALPIAASGGREVRARLLHLHCMVLPMLVVQLLATAKEGGGGQANSYNMEMIMLMLVPVPVRALASRLRRLDRALETAAIVAITGTGAKVAADMREGVLKRRDASWREQTTALGEVAALGKKGIVFASEPHFWVVQRAGLRIGTGSITMWHYAVADPEVADPRWLSGVERAIREQRYALISPYWSSSLPQPVIRRLTALIQANYAPAQGTKWLAPKSP